MQTSYFVIKARGEQRYYVCPGEFTPEQREARVVDEATAAGLCRVLPVAVDAVEVVPWWTGRHA